MIIKHNEAKEHFNVTYNEWFHDYLKKGKFKNFTVTNPKEVVELHSIDPTTGELKFSQLMDEKIAKQTKLKEPRRFHIKPLEFKMYDKNLVPNEEYFKVHPDSSIRPHIKKTNQKTVHLSRLRFFKNIKYINPIKRLDVDSKRHITIVLLMVITIVAMFVIAYYQGVFS